ncbi:hypothetical protein LOK82_10825 [Xylella fastidiosa subsp. multiplex]|uniref:Uncharacterized protein n=1 Tax=Xylella fastidiosa subsp. multiplex TaxID=644357 RepID=A0AAW6HX89_XYLFS|nr:hypothetical protein [Xylella fastidiosa subsp. multiplex]
MAAWQSLKRAGVLLRGMDADALTNTQGAASVALGAILSHLGDPAVTEIEALVFEQTAIKTPMAPPTGSAQIGSMSTSTPAAPICCAS